VWPDHRRLIDNRISAKFKGIEGDVRALFFGLDALTLRYVFNVYEKCYGKGRRKYAEREYGRWKAGSVQMSGEVSERLLKILPWFLSFEHKYQLVAKLWRGYRRPTRLRVEVSRQGGLEACLATLVGAAQAVEHQVVPSAVMDSLAWLADEDALAARALLHQVLLREGEITTDTLRAELRLLFDLAASHPEQFVRAERVVELPSATVEIVLTQHAVTQYRSRAMSHTNGNAESRDLVPTEASRRNLPAAPIQNAGDLLNEAFRRLPPDRIDEMIAKAGEEAMRLQIMQKEGEIEKAVIEGKVGTLVDAVRRVAGDPNVKMTAETQHKGTNGTTTVTIASATPPPPPPPPQARREFCFVATACYGNYDHPTVFVLRRFRDRTLMATPSGRRLVDVYYRWGPALAGIIDREPSFKAPTRLLLGFFAAAYSRFWPI
jgi:hypothetical protein